LHNNGVAYQYRKTGIPIYPAIVWQDRRTHALCKELAKRELGEKIYEKTGLLLDPYFSATKILWILEQVPEARKRAERSELAFGIEWVVKSIMR